MADVDRVGTRYHYEFIHNVFASFFADTLDYFTEYLHPRFVYRVVGVYSKAVEFLSKKDQYGREVDKPRLPALILNPVGEVNLADAVAGGRFLWRGVNLAPGFIKRLFDPIYQDSNIRVDVGFLRLKGEIELIILLNSFYEYCDLRLFLLQIFGGIERVIYPRRFSSFVILPEELINYSYSNEYTGENYTIDWESAGATEKLVKTTNRTELTVPCEIKPTFKLTGLSDGSTKYGGSDKLADWRLTASIEYEVEIPSYLILESDYLAENIQLEVKYSSCYSEYTDYQPPVNRELTDFAWDFGLDSTSHSEITVPSEATKTNLGTFVFKTRYFYTVLAADATSEVYFDITIEEQITNNRLIIVNSVSGKLDYGDHFTIINDGRTLRIKVDKVTLTAGMIIEMYIYERVV